jgi:hypothetical protein
MAATRGTPARKVAPKKVTTVKGGRDDGRETVALPIGDLTVNFKRPIGGQLAALRRASALFGSSDRTANAKGGLLFLETLDALVVDDGMLDRLYSGLANEEIPLEEYGMAVVGLLQHFTGDEDEAPTNGPVSTRRARVRR